MGRNDGFGRDDQRDGLPQVPVVQRLGAIFLTVDDLRDLRKAGSPRLTPSQMLTLRGLIAGKKEPEIAAILGRTPRAVKAHIQGIYQRYNCGKNPRPHQILAKAMAIVIEGRDKRAGERKDNA